MKLLFFFASGLMHCWRVSRIITDKLYLKILYRGYIGKKLNIENPISFNEKLQWLKLYDRNEKYVKMVDKYEAKKYVSELIGEEFIIPTIGIWDKYEDIDFSSLPNRFVLKCTHDSGSVVICSDKEKFDYKKAKKTINNALRKNFYYPGREWPYKEIKPRIIAEEFLEAKESCDTIDNNLTDKQLDLADYKLMCFNGKVKCSFVVTERFSNDGFKVTFFDEKWKRMPFERKYPSSKKMIEKPKQYDLMVRLAEKLSTGIPFVRVDFYEVKGHVFFGELTFFPGSGLENFQPEEWDIRLGEWLQLPKDFSN